MVALPLDAFAGAGVAFGGLAALATCASWAALAAFLASSVALAATWASLACFAARVA